MAGAMESLLAHNIPGYIGPMEAGGAAGLITPVFLPRDLPDIGARQIWMIHSHRAVYQSHANFRLTTGAVHQQIKPDCIQRIKHGYEASTLNKKNLGRFFGQGHFQ